jgi:hypothetical protein
MRLGEDCCCGDTLTPSWITLALIMDDRRFGEDFCVHKGEVGSSATKEIGRLPSGDVDGAAAGCPKSCISPTSATLFKSGALCMADNNFLGEASDTREWLPSTGESIGALTLICCWSNSGVGRFMSGDAAKSLGDGRAERRFDNE